MTIIMLAISRTRIRMCDYLAVDADFFFWRINIKLTISSKALLRQYKVRCLHHAEPQTGGSQIHDLDFFFKLHWGILSSDLFFFFFFLTRVICCSESLHSWIESINFEDPDGSSIAIIDKPEYNAWSSSQEVIQCDFHSRRWQELLKY